MRTRYSIYESLSNIFDLIKTKILWRKARMIRHPFYCRGRKSMVFGEGFTTGRNCRFDMPGTCETLFLGKNVNIGDNNHIVAFKKVVIGDNCLLASKVFISDTNHGSYDNSDASSRPDFPPNARNLISKPTIIGKNVWIGENVVVLAGSVIGDGCVVGANSVVTGKHGNGEILVGAPAKALKKWNKEQNKWVRV